ncbi:DUF998 domain-containing protein [Lysobacter sp. CFH 32150]|uniref:DUF998 domain-containing protein n=1 Tax=Lysobacter sp. CFH 32150 TaxID=2927128 RepID=UPI001FA7223F|nr:DUF998 domain-containing protein [Lysobacter sp. CFH 32150]MCI4566880.1 DUF998 domain-containing protein [Lysobacter sp. CFH 32150]
MKSLYARFTPYFGSLAALSFALAVVGFGASLSGYSHARHPVSLLGAIGVPHAQAFNLLGFLLPGLLAVLAGLQLRRRMPAAAGWSARIGAQLIVLSALAFAAQGLLPLDPSDLYAPGARLHATAWMLWWIAFVPGAFVLAYGLRSLALVSVVAAAIVLGFGLFAPDALAPGTVQRIAFGAWFAWFAVAGITRTAISAPGSLPTTRT